MRHEHQHLTQLQLYRTGEYPCNYLPPRVACSQMVAPIDKINDQNFGGLLEQGFRRSGLYVYRPHCADCDACTPIRILTQAFTPNRSQQRCRRKFAHLSVHIVALDFSDEHFALYQRYINARHANGPMAHDTEANFKQFFLTSPITSFIAEFRTPTGDLVMASVIDQSTQGLSAVYTFFDPEPPYAGLGVYAILWQIQIAQTFQLPYVYLGYWIAQARKMAYKTQFTPYELRQNGHWHNPANPPSIDAAHV